MKTTKAELVDDGERMIPEYHKDNLFFAEHMTRYIATADFTKNKTVLDIASGSGYGTHIISKYAKKVFGVDVSQEAINYAKEKYPKINIEYIKGNGRDIPLDNKSVDVVTTFETIEHVEDYNYFLKEIKRVLKPNGIVILSTPNDLEYGEGNHFHIHEFKYIELLKLLKKYFKNVDTYFQSTWKSVLLGPLETHTSIINDNINTTNYNPISRVDDTLYFYFICSNNKIEMKLNPRIGLGKHLSEAKEDKEKEQYERNTIMLKENERKLEECKENITKLSEELYAIKSSRLWMARNKIAKIIGR